MNGRRGHEDLPNITYFETVHYVDFILLFTIMMVRSHAANGRYNSDCRGCVARNSVCGTNNLRKAVKREVNSQVVCTTNTISRRATSAVGVVTSICCVAPYHHDRK